MKISYSLQSLWSCGLGPVVRVYTVRFYAEFMVLLGKRYGLFPDGDHTMGGWGGLRTQSADAYIGFRVSQN